MTFLRFWSLCTLLLISYVVRSQFIDVTTAQIPQAGGDAQFGDLDADGDLDLIVLGFDNEEAICRISFNDGFGNFTPAFDLNLEGLSSTPSLALADYNQDGLVDFVTSGRSNEIDANGNRILKTILYRNIGGQFEIANDQLTGLAICDLVWGDADNDGDLYIQGNGFSSFDPDIYSTILYENVGNNVFSEIEVAVGVSSGNAEFGDYDSDGDLDIAVFGNPDFSIDVAGRLYENLGENEFTLTFELIDVVDAAIEWGDFDNDGDLDLAGTGYSLDLDTDVTFIYENTFSIDGEFIFHDLGLNIFAGDVDAADFNNDGLLDLGITGISSSIGFDPQAVVLQNNGGLNFSIFEFLPNHRFSFDWGDIDGDGLQDIVLTGVENNDFFATRILRNDGGFGVSAPSIPKNLVSSVDQNSVNLSWENPDPEIRTYNISLYGDAGQVILPAINFFNNTVQIPGKGYTQNLFIEINGLDEGTYFWSVQANSGSDVLSDFSIEESFEITNPLPVDPSPFELSVISINDEDFPRKEDFRIADIDNDYDYDIVVQEDALFFETARERVFRFDASLNAYLRLENYEISTGQGNIQSSISEFSLVDNDNLLDIVNYQGVFNNVNNTFENLIISFPLDFPSNILPLDYDHNGLVDFLASGEKPLKHKNGFVRDVNDFLRLETFSDFETKMSIDQITVYDINNDGKNDFLNVFQGLEYITNENFREVENSLLRDLNTLLNEASVFADRIAINDLDFDDDPDFVYYGVDNNHLNVGIVLNDDEVLSLQDSIRLPLSELAASGLLSNTSKLHVADIDGDMVMDILVGLSFFDIFEGVVESTGFLLKNIDNNTLELIDEFDGGILNYLDVDHDNDLDILSLSPFQLFVNETDNGIDLTAPSNLDSQQFGDTLLLEWNYSLPAHSFELHIEYAPLASPDDRENLLGANAYIGEEDEYLRKIFQAGNSSNSSKHLLTNLREGYYYWKVQAIMPNLMGSYFSEEQVFVYRPFDIDTLTTLSLNDFVNEARLVDFDLDGNQDAIFGINNIDNPETTSRDDLYINVDGKLEITNQNINVIGDTATALRIYNVNHDYNADGKPDLLYQRGLDANFNAIIGIGLYSEPFTYIYNEELTNTYGQATLFFEFEWDITVHDLNQDGLLDILFFNQTQDTINLRYTGGEMITKLAVPLNAGTFESNFILPGYPDIDNDGLHDLVVLNGFGEKLYTFYNSPEGFSQENSNVLQVQSFASQLSNFNDDDFIDVFGDDSYIVNSNGTLVNSQNNLVISGNLVDFDADGDFDLIRNDKILLNYAGVQFPTYKLLSNDVNSSIPILYADLDKNGITEYMFDLSLENEKQIVRVEPNVFFLNEKPEAPITLKEEIIGNYVILSWDGAIDSETTSEGLFYNLYVRSESDTIIYPYATSAGDKFFYDLGNSRNVERFQVSNLKDGTYFWAVQTIDQSFGTSPFSEEQSFEIFVGPELDENNTLVCEDEVATYTVQPTGFTYDFQFEGGIKLDSTENSMTIQWMDSIQTYLVVTNLEFNRKDSIQITVQNRPLSSFEVGEDLGTNAQIQFTDSSSTTVSSWEWDFGDGGVSSEQNPVYSYNAAGSYDVLLMVSNPNGCFDESGKELFITDIVPVRIADVVTPNNDGKNDFLYIENIERYPNNQLRVFSTSGGLIYETSGYANDWIPASNGSTLPEGNYLCVLKVDQFSTEIKKTFTIIRSR